MNQYISPFWFYMMDIVDTLKEVIFTFGVGMVLLGIAMLIICIAFPDDFSETVLTFAAKWKRIFIIAAIVCLIGALVPTDDAIYNMMMTKYTPAEIMLEDKSFLNFIENIFN